jgi:hypothetical protein
MDRPERERSARCRQVREACIHRNREGGKAEGAVADPNDAEPEELA